jgi:hypothetical protein
MLTDADGWVGVTCTASTPAAETLLLSRYTPLTYALVCCVCSRMTYASLQRIIEASQLRMLTRYAAYADVCWRMLLSQRIIEASQLPGASAKLLIAKTRYPYRILTYADAC